MKTGERRSGNKKRMGGQILLAGLLAAGMLSQPLNPMTAKAAEGIYAATVAELKAENPEQKFRVQANGLTVERSMADLGAMPVIVQENEDGTRYLNIVDTALVDGLIAEINGVLQQNPAVDNAWYYDESSASFFQYANTAYDSVSEGGRLRLLNELQACLAGGGKDVDVSLTEGDLVRTVSDVPEEMQAFRYDIKGSYTTNFRGSSANRINNIATAAGNINHAVLMPGQELSINAAFLPRTSANGYKAAGAYSGGKVIQAMGGGICQVSSTVYNAAMNAGLTITERHAHSMPVHYLPLGLDATISSGSKDLKIRNDYPFPVLFETSVEGKDVTVRVYTNALLTAGTSYRLHAVRTGSLSAKTYLEINVNGVVTEDRYIGASAYKPLIKEAEEAEED